MPFGHQPRQQALSYIAGSPGQQYLHPLPPMLIAYGNPEVFIAFRECDGAAFPTRLHSGSRTVRRSISLTIRRISGKDSLPSSISTSPLDMTAM